MCRLFGAISTKPLNAGFLLQTAPQALLVQSGIDRKRKQGDGWGLGWFEKGRPRIFKSPRPIYQDTKNVARAVFQAGGTVLVGHVRWASNPLKLPKHQLIGAAHTQPFQHGQWLFAHNGTLYIPREVKAALGPWAKYVKGKNDSEVLFYWLMKTVVAKGFSAKNIRQSLRDLETIWQTCKSRYPLYKYPYHGFNWALTNGQMLAAFCCVNPRGFDKAKALCRRAQPYYQLQGHHANDPVVVASEPLTLEKNWKPMKHGQWLMAQKTIRGVRLVFQDIL